MPEARRSPARSLPGGPERWSAHTAGGLLFGSSNPAYMPGGLDVKRVEVLPRTHGLEGVRAFYSVFLACVQS